MVILRRIILYIFVDPCIIDRFQLLYTLLSVTPGLYYVNIHLEMQV